MLEKIRNALAIYGETVEVILALFTAIAIGIELIGFLPSFETFWIHREEAENYAMILSGILSIAIGTEFIKMMLKPSMKNITEVLIFLIARHMIVEETSPMDNMISVISITILFLVQYFLIPAVREKQRYPHGVGRIRDLIGTPEKNQDSRLAEEEMNRGKEEGET